MKKQSAEPQQDGPMTFEAVSLDQHLRFRALPPREKIEALEHMAEFVDQVHAQRKARGLPVIEPESKRRR